MDVNSLSPCRKGHNLQLIGFRRPESTPAESPTVDDRRETDLRSSGSSKQEGRT